MNTYVVVEEKGTEYSWILQICNSATYALFQTLYCNKDNLDESKQAQLKLVLHLSVKSEYCQPVGRPRRGLQSVDISNLEIQVVLNNYHDVIDHIVEQVYNYGPKDNQEFIDDVLHMIPRENLDRVLLAVLEGRQVGKV